MRSGLIVLCTCLLLLSAVSVRAEINPPEVRILPGKLSIESRFILIVEPDTSEEISHVNWLVPITDTSRGTVPKRGDRYICYFKEEECGVSPFIYEGDWELEVNITYVNKNITGKALNVQVGDIQINPTILYQNDKIHIFWDTYFNGGLDYEVYLSDDLETPVAENSLTFNAEPNGYRDTIELPEGEYYFVFSAEKGDRYGGAAAIFTAGSTGPSGDYSLVADSVSLDMVKPRGQAFSTSQFRIKNEGPTVENLTVSLAEGMSDYISIALESATIEANDSISFTLSLVELNEALDINTVAEIKSAGSKVGEIPIKFKVSVVGDAPTNPCEDRPNLTVCDSGNGICCSNECREGAECCTDSDCEEDETCTSQFKCRESSGPVACTEGTCINAENCQPGFQETGEVCTGGICCKEVSEPVNECKGANNFELCDDNKGICCGQECVHGDCCSDVDCDNDEVCKENKCNKSTLSPQEFNLIPIIIIVVVILIVVVGFIYFIKKRGRGGPPENEAIEEDIWGEEESEPEEGGDELDEEF